MAFVRALLHCFACGNDVGIDAIMDNRSAMADFDNYLIITPDCHDLSFPRVSQ